MKKFISLFLFFIIAKNSFAQKDFEAKVNKVLGYIERSLDLNEKKIEGNRIDFFVYDISIDSSGSILNIHSLIMDSLSSLSKVLIVADSIKQKFHFSDPHYSKLLIPVLIIYSNDNEVISNNTMTILETMKIFETLSKCKIKNTFITRHIVINRFSVVK